LGPAFTLQKPLDEFWQAFAQLRRWVIAEQFPRLRNICVGTRHIAGLLRQTIDFCLLSQSIFDRQNEIFQLNRLILAKIKDVIHWAIVIECRHRALDNIIDVGVIAPRGAIPKLIDRLPGVNAPGELMNRQIGALSWSVNSEIPQRYDPNVVKVRVSRAKEFP